MTTTRFTRVNTEAVFTLAIFLLCTFAFPQYSTAQCGGAEFRQLEEIDTNIGTFHYLVTPGTASIEISAFGDLVSPGIYILEENTDLAFLLALTGGPSVFNQPDVRYETTIRLFRNSGGAQSLIYEAAFEEVMDQISNAPVLNECDVVTVEVKQIRRTNWRDIFTIIGPVLSTLLLIDQLSRR